MKKIKVNNDGSINGVPPSVLELQEKNKYKAIKATQNQTSCSGRNTASCQNSGDCSDTTNTNSCSNTGSCYNDPF